MSVSKWHGNNLFTVEVEKYDYDCIIVNVSIECPANGIKFEFHTSWCNWIDMIEDYDESKPIHLDIDDNGGGYSAYSCGKNWVTFEGINSHGQFTMRRSDFNFIVEEVDKLLKMKNYTNINDESETN